MPPYIGVNGHRQQGAWDLGGDFVIRCLVRPTMPRSPPNPSPRISRHMVLPAQHEPQRIDRQSMMNHAFTKRQRRHAPPQSATFHIVHLGE